MRPRIEWGVCFVERWPRWRGPRFVRLEPGRIRVYQADVGGCEGQGVAEDAVKMTLGEVRERSDSEKLLLTPDSEVS